MSTVLNPKLETADGDINALDGSVTSTMTTPTTAASSTAAPSTTTNKAPMSLWDKWNNATDNRFDFGRSAYLEAIPDLASANATAQGVAKQQLNTTSGLANLASNRANRISQYDGMEDRYANDAFNHNSEANQELVAGKAAADVAQKFAAAKGEASRELSRMGVNPSSGRFASMFNQAGIASAAAQAQAMAKARSDLEKEANDRQKTAIGFGANLANQATSAAQNSALIGNSAINAAGAPLKNRLDFAGGISNIYGNAASGYGDLWKSTNLSAAQQAQLDANNAANESNGYAALLGAGAKLLGTATNGGKSTVAGDIWNGISNAIIPEFSF